MSCIRFPAALLLALASATGAHAAAFYNGSFESLSIDDGTNRTIDQTLPRRTLDGWVAVGQVQLRDPSAGETRQATDGENFVFLTNGASISQTFDTIVGHTYHVAFDFSKNAGTGKVLLDGLLQESLGGPVLSTMQAADGFDFIGDGSAMTLSFVAQGQQPRTLGRLWIDNVRIVTLAVPEAPPVSMMLGGLAVLGFVSARRRARR